MELFDLTEEQQIYVRGLDSMIESCFAYGGAEEGTYNFNRYILPYKDKLPENYFELAYALKMVDLRRNYQIVEGVYTDVEGGVYNSLQKIN
jgi:hypothetical protein